jgi:hypothetical protein
VRTKNILRKLSTIGKYGKVKNCLFALILITTVSTLGLIPLSQNLQQKFRYIFNPSPTIPGSSYLDASTPNQDKYTLFDDNSNTDSKKFYKQFPTANPGFLTNPFINSYVVGFLDLITFSLYISFFASLLRSPPFILA